MSNTKKQNILILQKILERNNEIDDDISALSLRYFNCRKINTKQFHVDIYQLNYIINSAYEHFKNEIFHLYFSEELPLTHFLALLELIKHNRDEAEDKIISLVTTFTKEKE